MVVILEFSVGAEEFLLGEVLGDASPADTIELERVVPLGDQTIPFLWVSSADFELFERSVGAHDAVAGVEQLGEIDGLGLYQISWSEVPPHQLVAGLVDASGTLLEAQEGDRWLFRVRFPSHDHLGQFYNYCSEHDVPIRVERILPLTPTGSRGPLFELSTEQRDAVLLALERGYFDTPRETTLEELGADLEISQQAVSDRIRRGVRRVLKDSLSSTTD